MLKSFVFRSVWSLAALLSAIFFIGFMPIKAVAVIVFGISLLNNLRMVALFYRIRRISIRAAQDYAARAREEGRPAPVAQPLMPVETRL